MALYLGILIFAFIVTSIAIVPFIDYLYKLRFTRKDERAEVELGDTAEFRKFHAEHSKKVGTPIGGGLLIIFLVSLLYALLFGHSEFLLACH